MINFKKSSLRLDNHSAEVLKKASSAVIVKALGMAIGLTVSVFLGRVLGAEGLGTINLANRIVMIIVVLCMMGFYQVLIKEVAIAYSNRNFKHIANSIRSAITLNGLLAIFFSICMILLTPYISNVIFEEEKLKTPLVIMLTVVIFQVISRIYSAGLVGFKKIWQSNLVDETLNFLLVAIFLLFMHLNKNELTVKDVAIVYSISRFLVFSVSSIYWKKLFIYKGKVKTIVTTLIKSSLPLFLVSITAIISTSIDVIMIGWITNVKEVGLYVVASRIALITSFFLQVTNTAISPKIAALFSAGKIKEINRMVQRITLGLILIGLLSVLFFVLFGEYVLTLWGNEFSNAYLILIVLGIGQFFNIGTGAAGYVLTMCGFEKTHAYISVFSILLNILLSYFLISNFGALGGAIASAIVVTITNVIKVIFAKLKTNILTVPIKNFK